MRKQLIINIIFLIKSSCLLGVEGQSDALLNPGTAEKSANAFKLSDDELRKTLKKHMKGVEQASTTWDEYKCSNLYSCSSNGLTFRFGNSISTYFNYYAFAFFGTLAGSIFLKYRKIHAPLVLSFTALMLANGRSSCDNVCALITHHRGLVKLVEDILTSRGHVIKTQ